MHGVKGGFGMGGCCGVGDGGGGVKGSKLGNGLGDDGGRVYM